VSKIIEHAEKNESAEVICANCPGHFQQVADNSTVGLFKTKIYQKWFWLCNHCGFKSKTHCAKINKEMKK
jgi:C4-type Zn-finger protein